MSRSLHKFTFLSVSVFPSNLRICYHSVRVSLSSLTLSVSLTASPSPTLSVSPSPCLPERPISMYPVSRSLASNLIFHFVHFLPPNLICLSILVFLSELTYLSLCPCLALHHLLSLCPCLALHHLLSLCPCLAL